MFTRVLVPLDDGSLARRVLERLDDVLDPGGSVVLVRVLRPGRREDLTERRERVEEAAAELTEVARPLLARGVTAEIQAVVGADPAREIRRLAGTLAADAILMATHARRGLRRLALGSVAEAVTRRAPVPVVLYGPDATGAPHGVRRILVPLDGSPRSGAALPRVEALARRRGAAVHLLHVAPHPPTGGYPAPIAGMPGPMGGVPIPAGALERSERDDRAELLEPARARLAAAGVEATVAVHRGDPAGEVLRAAEGSDLVVLSTRGLDGVERLLSGSVTEEVLRRCERPLLVLPDEPEPEGAGAGPERSEEAR